jgi:hypothetical protein
MIIIAITYLFFPNNNHLIDSVCYAGNVKFGVELFSSHHLLYTYFNYLAFRFFVLIFPLIDALRLMQLINGTFGLLCLLLLRKIIANQINNKKIAESWTFFVACSFGIMRFAVEAETYILPIFFSLLSSFFFLKYLRNQERKNVFLSGLFASIACLFHQIHIFWGIGLFLGLLFSKTAKSTFIFLLSTPIVLICYSLVLIFYNHVSFSISNLFRFFAEYYFTDKVDLHLGLKDILISAITFTRTFFQVHGVVVETLRLKPGFYIILAVVVASLFFLMFKTIKNVKFNPVSFSRKNNFIWTHFIIFFLQFGFAFFSHGNSEFMVMLPFLMAILMPNFLSFDLNILRGFAVCMLIWNFSFGIFPNNYFDFQNNKELAKIIHKHSDKIFILKERNAIANQYFYHYGIQENNRMIDNDDKATIRKLKLKNNSFCTDILTKKRPTTEQILQVKPIIEI